MAALNTTPKGFQNLPGYTWPSLPDQFAPENTSAVAGISATYSIVGKDFAPVPLLMLQNSRVMAPLVVD